MENPPPSPADEELARQCQGGNVEAFEALVHRYERRIYAFVLTCCPPGADAREITQETFLKAFQAIDQFDARRSFAPWLFTIARRKCIDYCRRAAGPAEAPLPELQDGQDPGEVLAQREDRQSLWETARRVLPLLQFQALWLKYAEEMDIAQMAQVLHKSRTHVKVLLFRARQLLGRELKPQAAGPSERPGEAKAGASPPAGAVVALAINPPALVANRHRPL